MLKIAEYTQKALELRNRAIKAFNAAGLDIRINENEDTGNIKLVFAGQYSAGKSSILKMLTGRNDIAIGAGITTQKVKDIFTTAASEVRGIGLEAADLLVEGCSQSEVEEKLAENVRKADAITEKCQQDAIQLIETRLTEMGQALDLIEDSEFTNQLKTRLSGKFNALPENIQKIIGGAGPGLQKAGQAVVDKAYKAGVQGGMKLSNFSGSAVHDIVLKAGHSVGFKFKPWQAVKITKGVAIGGRVLGVLGVGFSVFMQIKSDHDAEVLSAELKSNRQNIRSQFNTAANELESYGKTFIQNNVIHALEPSLSSVDSNIREIRESRNNRSSACREMERLQGECRKLITEVHSM